MVMGGRLDDPIREELTNLDVIQRRGSGEVGEHRGHPALLRILYRQRKYRKSALLTASLRGPWHVDGSITEGEVPIYITCFPDKAREYDSEQRKIVSRIAEKITGRNHERSDEKPIFRQAYEVGGLTPDGFDSFLPVVATLASFSESYDEFLEYNR